MCQGYGEGSPIQRLSSEYCLSSWAVNFLPGMRETLTCLLPSLLFVFNVFFLFILQIVPCYIPKIGLKPAILLPPLPEFQDNRYKLHCLAYTLAFWPLCHLVSILCGLVWLFVSFTMQATSNRKEPGGEESIWESSMLAFASQLGRLLQFDFRQTSQAPQVFVSSL